MTDTSFPVTAINGHDLSRHSVLPAAHTTSHLQRSHPPLVPHDPEDDGQISCICGFVDDDGWTVACDVCNKWQHQACYYPQYEEQSLPEELEHMCVDCNPRDIDANQARRRQVEKRGPSEPLANGVKRAVSKSHKKKAKESNGPQSNGWPVDKLRHDRNSASPRDQPPPAKRPKTSHRHSDSNATTATTKGHSRKRNASIVNSRRSASRSPESPIELYSEHFIQSYMDDDWAITKTNLHSSIGVTNAMSEWLNITDDAFHVIHDQIKGKVLMRWDGDLDDIPGKAQIDIIDRWDDSVEYNGTHPRWKTVTVQEPVPDGAYIGEIKGHVCFKQDYQEDPSNRWAETRHPEPFVFFHPTLPIAVDARNEGTSLRYVRRSCNPNAYLQILVTDGVHYHFCFMAQRQIEPGEEISIPWDTNEAMFRQAVAESNTEDMKTWISTTLSNCGPCACNRPQDQCAMARFDRRGLEVDVGPAVKAPKSKKRKNGQHVSPANTNAVNSRSGSEVRKLDPDDDGSESRSASGSAGRGSASRDITPNTHYSTNGAQPELSEREKKKLAKEEEMFRRQEEERSGKQAKKKRNSGGSNVNTLNLTSSKQLGLPVNGPASKDAGSQRQAGQSSEKSVPGRKTKATKSTVKPLVKVIKRPKPVYADAQTQCDLDKEEAQSSTSMRKPRRTCKSLRQRLLERCARNNQTILSSTPSSPAQRRISDPGDTMDIDRSDERHKTSPAESVVSDSSLHNDVSSKDIDMAEGPSTRDGISSPTEKDAHTRVKSVEPTEAGQQIPTAAFPPAPPWQDAPASKVMSPSQSSKPASMHLPMLPPATNPFAITSAAQGSMTQSPASITPGSALPPSVVAAVTPLKKKLSLSDYTRRKAKREDTDTKTDRESSPASVASGPTVAPLQPSSSAEARAAGGSAVEEDVKMEEADAENVPPATAA